MESSDTRPNAAAIRWLNRQRMLSSNHEACTVTGVNKFGKESDLSNEASVEQFFVGRLLTDLGYVDAQIRPKTSLSELPLHQGRTAVKWKPDYAIEVDGRIRWIIEAKAVTESLDDWVRQAGSYCLELNSTYDDNPVEYFMLTNGITTRVYRWDNRKHLIEAKFEEFVDDNPVYNDLRAFLGAENINSTPEPTVQRHLLRRHSVEQLNADFIWAHRLIFRGEALSYTAAFMEFVKVIFLKLQSDHDAHNNLAFREEDEDTGSVPSDDVRFSVKWIESMEKDSPSPLDQLHFARLTTEFEQLISESKMKRIFDKGEGLKLSADTIKALVRRFEHIDLRSIDADLNGRMFETFLNAALRGKDLGQFFTPRSVVKLATGLADLKVTGDQPTRVLDACCGTGGFLIEALSDMNDKADRLPRSPEQLAELKKKIQRSIMGVDVARDPALARIARINMYLHGDMDSKIFQLDALDKKVRSANNDDTELAREKAEFKDLLAAGEKKGPDGRPLGVVDVVLSNPPFA
jgi:type I restriction enzyme M protein